MPKRLITAEDLLKIQYVSDPQISPDGQRILFCHKVVNDKNKYITKLYVVDAEGGEPIAWTGGTEGAAHGRWSPDGAQIAFVSGREKPSAQIFLISTTGGEAHALTKLGEGSIGAFKWSPDGSHIAFLYRPTHPDRTEKAKKEREEKGLSTPPWEMDDIWYRLDGDGYFGAQRFALWVVEVATGVARELYTASSMGFYEFDWSPNSEELIVAHSIHKVPSREKPNDQLFRVDLEGDARQIPGLPAGHKGTVAWSPDGERIAYLGSRDLDDPWGTANTHLFVVKTDGSGLACLSEDNDYDLTVMSLSDSKDAGGDGTLLWSPDSRALYVSVGWHGSVDIGYVALAGGGVQLLTEGKHAIAFSSLSQDGEKIPCVYGNSTHLNEIAIYDLNEHPREPRVLTHFNKDFHDEILVSEPEDLWLESTDGSRVHAWVMLPPKAKPKTQYPGILEVHGGPHAQYGHVFFHEFQMLAAQGYVVVFSNPRGSKGYGQAHCAAIKGNWGVKDWEDIETVKRFMQHHPRIQSGKIGIMGGSYGGYMTCWAIGHTHDFIAAITDRCVSNLVSMSGSSDFASNKDEYFGGCAWGDHERIKELWRQSPIAYFEGVNTPTLIIHSEGDLRCNIEQGEQVFTALQMQGIETRFVRYPSTTSHGMSRSGPPDLRLHRLGEITNWWAKHLH